MMKEYFDQYFKSSDLDFYIILDNPNNIYNNEQIKKINDDIQGMAYLALNIARIFIINNKDLFNFCIYNIDYIDELFDRLLNRINDIDEKQKSQNDDVMNSEMIGLGFGNHLYIKNNQIDIDNLNVNQIPSFITGTDDSNTLKNYQENNKSGHYDISIHPINLSDDTSHEVDKILISKINYCGINGLFSDNFGPIMNDIVDKGKILDFYISSNSNIENKKDQQHFRLLRLMINFLLVYKRDEKYGVTNVPSELYDISIGEPDDRIYDKYTIDGITKYTYKYEDKSDTIYIPTIETLIVDLNVILYEYRKYPWSDPKYKKRLYRLLILIMINQLMKSNLYDVKKDLLDSNSDSNLPDSNLPKTKPVEFNFEYISFVNERIRQDVLQEKDETISAKYIDYINEINNTKNKLLDILITIENYIVTAGKYTIEDMLVFR